QGKGFTNMGNLDSAIMYSVLSLHTSVVKDNSSLSIPQYEVY
ncbi:hypothetical protein PROFUN_17003, partial [Planoprotostelium fungivorum]